jgi:hypothetical protein
MEVLPQSVLDIIAVAVTQAAQQTAAAMQRQEPERNYFKIMEKLLYSYPALKRIVSDKAGYTKVELRERSKSVVGFSFNSQWKSKDDVIDELEQEKEVEFDTTLKDFRRLDRVIQQFRERKEFIVVRMYYFNENADGTPKEVDAPQATWEDLSAEIGKEIKTLSRWRNNIVNDMAICLFGIDAAIQQGTERKK